METLPLRHLAVRENRAQRGDGRRGWGGQRMIFLKRCEVLDYVCCEGEDKDPGEGIVHGKEGFGIWALGLREERPLSPLPGIGRNEIRMNTDTVVGREGPCNDA